MEKELGALVLPDDSTKYLPGDELIPDAKYSDADNVNIEAPVFYCMVIPDAIRV